MSHTHKGHYLNARILKLNVGFIIAKSAGFSRTTDLNIQETLQVAPDLFVERLQGSLRLTRTSEGVLLQGELECTRWGECSRCLVETQVSFDLELEELYTVDYRDESAFSIGEDGILDLAPLLREEIIINTPSQLLCRDVCKGLCPNCGQNWNEGDCDCEEDLDPRWAVLAELQKRRPDQQ